MSEQKILFVCRANVGRSQIAEALYNKYTDSNNVSSAGTNVNENDGKAIGDNEKARFVWEVMDEEGVDVRDYKRKQLTPQMVDDADKVIAITEKEDCPDYLRNNSKTTYWDIEDAKGADYDFHIKTRDEIKEKVVELVKTNPHLL